MKSQPLSLLILRSTHKETTTILVSEVAEEVKTEAEVAIQHEEEGSLNINPSLLPLENVQCVKSVDVRVMLH